MINREISDGEIGVLGLARSGTAAAKLLLTKGLRVYASDGGSSPQVQQNARAILEMDGNAETGRHDLERIARAALVVVSPGIEPSAPAIVAAREAGVTLVSEVEIALRMMPELKVIAVTGTNGKTTTTALVGHILRTLGVNAVDAGNIGTPLSEAAAGAVHPEWAALEMSSFQLHDTPGLDPVVGVLTNLSPDHLDRYPGVDEYYADKARLFSNAHDGSRWVLNADDQRVLAMAAGADGTSYLFSTHERADAWLDEASGSLQLLREPLMSRGEFNLLGDHNVANALAAALAVSVAGEGFQSAAARSRIAHALRTFKPLAHRMEIVAELGGVQWINDSKATNVSSTLVAVNGMRRPTILLLGGRHKGEPYTGLADAAVDRVKKIIAYGEAAAIIERDLGPLLPVERLGSDFEAVIRRARESAEPGDAVLLSPACSSYDMFRNYEERGDRFRQLASGK